MDKLVNIVLLSGVSGAGKSTLLQKELKKREIDVSGFYVTRHKQNIDDEMAIGYSMHIHKNDGTEKPLLKIGKPECELFLDFRTESKTNHDVLTKFAKEVKENIKNTNPDLVLLDEIGGVELKNDEFSDFLYWVTENYKCIGVIKDIDSLKYSHHKNIAKKLEELIIHLEKQNSLILKFDSYKDNEKSEIVRDFLDNIIPQ